MGKEYVKIIKPGVVIPYSRPSFIFGESEQRIGIFVLGKGHYREKETSIRFVFMQETPHPNHREKSLAGFF